MKQYLKRSTAWMLCLALLLGLFAGIPGAVITKASAAETEPSEEVQNLLADYNASFEDHEIAGWTIDKGVNQSRQQATDGNAWSLKISVQDAAATSSAVAVRGNWPYDASVEVLGAGKLTIFFYDAEGVVVGEESAECAASDAWTTLTVEDVMSPVTAVTAVIKLSATTADAVYFDNASLKVSEYLTSANIVNADFETGDLTGWKGGTVIREDNGNYANQVAINASSGSLVNVWSQPFELIPGMDYVFTMDIQTPQSTYIQFYTYFFEEQPKDFSNGGQIESSYRLINSETGADEWDTLATRVALPANAKYACIRLLIRSNTTEAGTVLVDNAKFTLNNTWYNGDYEDNAVTTLGLPMGVWYSSEKTGTFFNTDPANAHSGNNSLRLCNSKWLRNFDMNVVAGERYTSSFWFKPDDFANWDGEIINRIYFYDANRAEISRHDAKGVPAADEWTFLSQTVVAPEGAVHARVEALSVDSAFKPDQKVIYIDDATFTMVEPANLLTNADFETATISNNTAIPKWVVQSGKVTDTEVAYTDAEHGYSAHISANGNQVWLASQRFAAIPGEKYTASAKFSGTAGYAQVYIRFAKDATTTGAIAAPEKRVYGQTVTFTAESSGWVAIEDLPHTNLAGETYIKDGEITLTVPKGANYVYILIVAQPDRDENNAYTNADLYIDDVSLVKSADHTYSANAVEGSCTEDAYTEYVCLCGDSYIDESTRVVADGHDYQTDVTDPDCTNIGYTTYTCADCGDTYKGDEVDAKGHTAGEPVVENKVEPDCDTAGSYESVVYCTICGAELSRQTIAIDPVGHTEGEAVVENTVDATCSDAGSYDSVVYCTVCGEEVSRQTIAVDTLPHTPAEAVIENNVAPDCTNTGSFDTVVYCSICGAEMSRVTTTVDALGHTAGEPVVENNVAPDCTTPGSYDTVVYCAVCGAEMSRVNSEVDAHGHDYEAVVTDPTCTAAGYTTYTCKTCGSSYVSEYVDALGHTDGEAVKENIVEPDCENKGSYDTVVYCTVCGAETSRVTTTIAALGHTPSEAVTEIGKEADCTSGYYYEVIYCSVCGDEISRSGRIYEAALGHEKAPEVAENVINPTCTSTGSYEAVTYCSVCGEEILRRVVEIPKLDHTYPETGVVTAPTCMKAGYTAYNCVDCGYRYISDEVPATGHAWTDDADTTCDNGCGYVRTMSNGNMLNGFNHDFEDYGIADWTVSDGVTLSRIADENKVTQSWCLRLAINGATATSQSVATLPGWPYTLTAKILGEGEVSIVFYDANNNMVDRIAVPANTDAWETISFENLTSPEKAYSAKIVLTATGDEPVYFDDLYFTCGEDVRLVSVPNGDFEDTENPGWFYNSGYRNESGIVELEDGNHAFYVTTNDLPFQFKSAPFEIRPGKAYMATIRAQIPADGFLQVYIEYFHNDTQYMSNDRLASTYRATDIVTEAGEWVDIAVLMDSEIPADATHARFLVKTSYATSGTFYFDDARVFQIDGLYNAGFEGTVTNIGLPMGYTMSSENEETAAEYVNTDTQFVYEGSQSLHLQNQCWIFSHYINIHPGETYESSFQIMTDAQWNKEVDATVVNRIYFYDADFKPIHQDTENEEDLAFISACSTTIVPTGEWTPFVNRAVAPDNAVYARVMVVSQRGASCYLDNGNFQKAVDSNQVDHADFENVKIKDNSTIANWTGYGVSRPLSAADFMEITYVPGHDKVAHINAYGTQVWLGSYRFEAIPGQKYTASAIFSGTAGYVQMYVRFAETLTSGAGILSTQEPNKGMAETNTFADGFTDWIQVKNNNATDILGNKYIQNGEITMTVPKGANYVYVLIVGQPERNEDNSYGELDFYVDDVSLRKTAEHTYNPSVTAPTCTEQGYTTMICDCGDSYIDENSYVPANGHTNSEAVIENNVAPDCTNTGSYDTVVYCSVCGAEVSRVTTVVAALGHTEVVDAAVAPGCESTGLTEGKHCSVCGTVLVAQEEVAATGHAYTSEQTKAPTCTEEGELTFTCGNCGDTYTEAVAALGHTEVIDAAVAPGCESTGLTEGKHCSVCGTVLVAQEEVAATGHIFDHDADPNCNVCGYVREIDFDTPISKPELEFMDKSINLSDVAINLSSYIGAQFIVDKAAIDAGNYEKVYIIVEVNGVLYKYDTSLLDDMYIFEHPLAPKDMAEEMLITVYAEKNGLTYYGATATWTVKEGIMSRLDKFFPKINHATMGEAYYKRCVLLVDLLYYGAAAQTQFGTDTNGLITDGLDEEYAELKTTNEPVIAAENTAASKSVNELYQYNLGLESAVNMQFTFRLATTEYSEYTVKITHDGTVYEYGAADFHPASGNPKFVTVVFDKLESVGMRETVTVELYQNGTLVSQTYTASIEGTAKINIDKNKNVELVKAMMTFGDSACASLT